MIGNNSWSRHARETKFVPDSALDIPAFENKILRVAAGKLYTGNDQQVGLLRMLLKSISNGIFVNRAVKELKTKKGLSNNPENNTGFAQISHHWKARLKGYFFREFRLADNFVGKVIGLEVGLPKTPLYYMPTSSPVRKCRHRKVRIKM